MALLHLIIFIILLSQSRSVKDVNCCLLGNFTSTDWTAASSSGNMILYCQNIHLLMIFTRGWEENNCIMILFPRIDFNFFILL